MNSVKTSAPISQRSFRLYLQRELALRSQKNPNYSLRAFAKSLQIDPSLLSKLIGGKRKISAQQVKTLGLGLNLSLRRIECFEEYSGTVDSETEDFHQISLDQFDIISQWQHYAILEMMSLTDFQPSVKWIAEKLEIKPREAKGYVERLQRAGLLKILDSGEWQDLSQGRSTHVLGENITSQAHKQSQKTILTQAINSLDRVPIEQRDQSSMMMASDPKRIHVAKQMIKRFRRQLNKFLEEAEEKTAVYQFSVSLFPIVDTHPIQEKL